jgi:hypothetical protein
METMPPTERRAPMVASFVESEARRCHSLNGSGGLREARGIITLPLSEISIAYFPRLSRRRVFDFLLQSLRKRAE